MRYAFIRDHRDHHSVAELCRQMDVSRSGFHAWQNRTPSKRAVANAKLLVQIRRTHLEVRGAYGSVKTWKHLIDHGVACGKHRVARLRREAGIEAKRRTRQRLTVEHHKTAASAPDLLNRGFGAGRLNEVWAGDLTFIRTREGWLHLAVLLDLCSRSVVGYAMDERPGQSVHVGALQMALKRRHPKPGLIHHTDRGTQYRTTTYRNLMARHGLIASMNGRKVPQDNAVAESFFSTLKNELIHHVDLRTRAEAKALIADYIERFYNRKRLHQSLGYRTPEQVERQKRGA